MAAYFAMSINRDKGKLESENRAEGWSPYFVKYGRSRLYHGQFMEAEAQA